MSMWKSYRHRFIPWLALNWSTRLVKQSDVQSNLAKEKKALSQLTSLLQALDNTVPHISPWELRQLIRDPSSLQRLAHETSQVMSDVYGFSLELQESRLPGGGRGVFVSPEGKEEVPGGHIVGLYPGTVYLPFEPLFFQSIGNPFIFRCADGWHIDSHHRGLSRWIYKSCAYRDVIGQYMSCDPTWLLTTPINPLSIGQFVNNHTRDLASNVEYVELSVPADMPVQWRRFLPNIFYSVQPPHTREDDTRLIRSVAVVTTREILPGEELYSSYFTLVTE